MLILQTTFLIAGALVCAFLALFAVRSLTERQPRAAVISVVILILFALFWFGGYFLLEPSIGLIVAALTAMAVFTILFFTPTGNLRTLKIGDIAQRFDERDVVFSREEYEPGSEKYEQYYAMRPEYKAVDDRMRKLPELLEPGGRFYDPKVSDRIDATFDGMEKLLARVDGLPSEKRSDIDPAAMTRSVKQMVLDLGADEVGIATLNPMFVYSHVGRGPEKWGEPIVNNHKFAVAFTLEMRYQSVAAAPGLPITEETATQYVRAANISIELAGYIRSLGYPARAHIAGSNYQVILPPVAHDAGLGELGRMGYLISPKYGGRIRLGAVTTDLPLIPDKPVSFGVQDFCVKCLKCAVNCPPAAIPAGDTTKVREVHKWPLGAEQCLHYWRTIGTDCGLCMKVCPYSHPPTLVHNVVRAGIRRSSLARTLAVWADDLFYGRKIYRA